MSDSISHPRSIEVSICGGEHIAIVRKWKMRDRANLKPKLAAVFEKLNTVQGGLEISLDLAPMFLEAEEEISEVARLSTDLPGSMDWGDVDWEDIPDLVQAVWSLNVFTAEGGGLVGKTTGLLSPLISSSRTIESKPSGPDSSSSPEDGDQPQSSSLSN